MILRVLETILEGCRHLQCASNGEEALAIVIDRMSTGEEFDLIFMDCLMPVMDGYTAVQTMRKLGYKGPILALTGNTSQEDINKAKEAGYNTSLLKPIKSNDLLTVIQLWTSFPPILSTEIFSNSSAESPKIAFDEAQWLKRCSIEKDSPFDPSTKDRKSKKSEKKEKEKISSHTDSLIRKKPSFS
jgi:CheY-like chemotaxis protein